MFEMILLVAVTCLALLNIVMIGIVMSYIGKLMEGNIETLKALTFLITKNENLEKQNKAIIDQLTDYQQTTRRQFRTFGDSFKYISQQLEKLDGDLDDLITNVGEDMTNIEYRYTSIYDQFEYIQRELKKLSNGMELSLDIQPPVLEKDDLTNRIEKNKDQISLFDIKKDYFSQGIPEAHFKLEGEAEA